MMMRRMGRESAQGKQEEGNEGDSGTAAEVESTGPAQGGDEGQAVSDAEAADNQDAVVGNEDQSQPPDQGEAPSRGEEGSVGERRGILRRLDAQLYVRIPREGLRRPSLLRQRPKWKSRHCVLDRKHHIDDAAANEQKEGGEERSGEQPFDPWLIRIQKPRGAGVDVRADVAIGPHTEVTTSEETVGGTEVYRFDVVMNTEAGGGGLVFNFYVEDEDTRTEWVDTLKAVVALAVAQAAAAEDTDAVSDTDDATAGIAMVMVDDESDAGNSSVLSTGDGTAPPQPRSAGGNDDQGTPSTPSADAATGGGAQSTTLSQETKEPRNTGDEASAPVARDTPSGSLPVLSPRSGTRPSERNPPTDVAAGSGHGVPPPNDGSGSSTSAWPSRAGPGAATSGSRYDKPSGSLSAPRPQLGGHGVEAVGLQQSSEVPHVAHSRSAHPSGIVGGPARPKHTHHAGLRRPEGEQSTPPARGSGPSSARRATPASRDTSVTSGDANSPPRENDQRQQQQQQQQQSAASANIDHSSGPTNHLDVGSISSALPNLRPGGPGSSSKKGQKNPTSASSNVERRGGMPNNMASPLMQAVSPAAQPAPSATRAATTIAPPREAVAPTPVSASVPVATAAATPTAGMPSPQSEAPTAVVASPDPTYASQTTDLSAEPGIERDEEREEQPQPPDQEARTPPTATIATPTEHQQPESAPSTKTSTAHEYTVRRVAEPALEQQEEPIDGHEGGIVVSESLSPEIPAPRRQATTATTTASMEEKREEQEDPKAAVKLLMQLNDQLNTSLETQRASAEQQTLQLTGKVRELEAALQEQQQQNQVGVVGTEQFLELQREYRELQLSHTAAQRDLEQARESCRVHQGDVSTLQRELQRREADVRASTAALQDRDEKLAAATTVIAELRQAAEVTHSTLQANMASEDRLRHQNDSLRAQVAQLQDTNNALNAQLALGQEVQQRLEHDLAQTTEELKSAWARVQQAEEEAGGTAAVATVNKPFVVSSTSVASQTPAKVPAGANSPQAQRSPQPPLQQPQRQQQPHHRSPESHASRAERSTATARDTYSSATQQLTPILAPLPPEERAVGGAQSATASAADLSVSTEPAGQQNNVVEQVHYGVQVQQQQQIQQLQQQLQDAGQATERLRTDLSQERERARTLQSELSALQQDHNWHVSRVQTLEQAENQRTSALRDIETQRDLARKVAQQSDVARQDAIQRCQAMESERNAVKQQADQLRERCHSLQEAQVQLSRLESDHREVQLELHSLRSSYEETRTKQAELLAEVNTLRRTKAELERETDRFRAEQAEGQDRVAQASKEQQRLQQELSRAQQELRVERDNAADAKRESDATKESIEDARSRCQALQAQVPALEKRVRDLEWENADLNNARVAKGQECLALQERTELLEQRVAAHAEKLRDTEANRDDVVAQLADAAEALKQAESVQEELRLELTSERAELDRGKTALMELRVRAEQLQTDLESEAKSRMQCETVLREREQQLEEMEALRHKMGQLDQSLSQERAEHSITRKEVERLQEDLHNATELHQMHEQEARQMRTTMAELRDRITALEKELNRQLSVGGDSGDGFPRHERAWVTTRAAVGGAAGRQVSERPTALQQWIAAQLRHACASIDAAAEAGVSRHRIGSRSGESGATETSPLVFAAEADGGRALLAQLVSSPVLEQDEPANEERKLSDGGADIEAATASALPRTGQASLPTMHVQDEEIRERLANALRSLRTFGEAVQDFAPGSAGADASAPPSQDLTVVQLALQVEALCEQAAIMWATRARDGATELEPPSTPGAAHGEAGDRAKEKTPGPAAGAHARQTSLQRLAQQQLNNARLDSKATQDLGRTLRVIARGLARVARALHVWEASALEQLDVARRQLQEEHQQLKRNRAAIAEKHAEELAQSTSREEERLSQLRERLNSEHEEELVALRKRINDEHAISDRAVEARCSKLEQRSFEMERELENKSAQVSKLRGEAAQADRQMKALQETCAHQEEQIQKLTSELRDSDRTVASMVSARAQHPRGTVNHSTLAPAHESTASHTRKRGPSVPSVASAATAAVSTNSRRSGSGSGSGGSEAFPVRITSQDLTRLERLHAQDVQSLQSKLHAAQMQVARSVVSRDRPSGRRKRTEDAVRDADDDERDLEERKKGEASDSSNSALANVTPAAEDARVVVHDGDDETSDDSGDLGEDQPGKHSGGMPLHVQNDTSATSPTPGSKQVAARLTFSADAGSPAPARRNNASGSASRADESVRSGPLVVSQSQLLRELSARRQQRSEWRTQPSEPLSRGGSMSLRTGATSSAPGSISSSSSSSRKSAGGKKQHQVPGRRVHSSPRGGQAAAMTNIESELQRLRSRRRALSRQKQQQQPPLKSGTSKR